MKDADYLGSKPVRPFRVSSFDQLNPDECEALLLHTVLNAANGNLSDAADRLGVDEYTFSSKLSRYLDVELESVWES